MTETSSSGAEPLASQAVVCVLAEPYQNGSRGRVDCFGRGGVILIILAVPLLMGRL
jgi:hypothetical protein